MTSNASEAKKFAMLIQDFFCKRLIDQQNVSARTVASYRDTFRLLLQFAEQDTRKCPTYLTLDDLSAPFILAFLNSLEQERGNSARTRNIRLAAIRSFMRYVAMKDPACLPAIQRVLAIPLKRFDRPVLTFLSREEMQAVIEAPDNSTWNGHRDRVMFTIFYNTGARVSEITGLRVGDVLLERECAIRISGKGRKQRVIPLWKKTVAGLKKWMARIDGNAEAPVFPNHMGKPLSRSGVEYRLRVAIKRATSKCPSLQGRRISPHTLRHTTAMHLLQAGVDITVIALWLGHETPSTTHLYVEADLSMKERALEKLQEPPATRVRYQPSDRILAFLESL